MADLKKLQQNLEAKGIQYRYFATGQEAADYLDGQIDGVGHRKVYFVVGINKLEPDFERALWRARNVAAPKRAQSLGKHTPCAAKADRCYDCSSPERVCRALNVIWCRPTPIEHMEVVLIGEELGM